MYKEKIAQQYSGWGVLFLFIAVIFGCIWGFINGVIELHLGYLSGLWFVIPSILIFIFSIIMLSGLFTVEPNEARVLILFGKYVGTEKTTGFRWANPLYTKRRISLRARNFDGDKLKVNDKKGNPIEISVVVVWKVHDTAEACFEVDNFIDYVHINSESAVRHLATNYSYDLTDTDEELSLRSSLDEVSVHLAKEIQERVEKAGVEIIDARINHLAYAQEIAHAMLQRQQAEAIISARQKIVEGAVGMVDMAITMLKEQGVVDLDEEKKATMVNHLMVVLCSERATQPIVNTGSIY